MSEEQNEEMYAYHDNMANCVQCPYCLSDLGINEINEHIKGCQDT